MKKTLVLIIVAISFNLVFAQADSPKREFRSAWVASVTNLDWPVNPLNPPATQKENLITILDSLKAGNFNVVMFQIRTECDALYDSPYEPWSFWLTGTQGVAPSPMYDPLEFAIEEVHKRGMEIHAWFNPYRAVKKLTGTNSYTPSADHVTNLHPDWILTFSNMKILDPGLPEVRQYNLNIIMDVVNRYDIDGVHMDDYFYPYPPDQISNQDQATYQQYGSGFNNIGDWRRWNVNQQMTMIMDSINTVKPYVKFGISPFGIWKSGVPAGISGMNAYSVIYADPIAWLHDHSVDYLTPQLYWKIGGPQDYAALSAWWADSAAHYNRHIYPGHIFNTAYNNVELPAQLRIDRNNDKIQGSVFFRATHLKINEFGFLDSLKKNYYKYKAFPPLMNWKDTVKPSPVENVTFDRLPGMDVAGLMWENTATAADGDSSYRFAIYSFNTGNINETDIDNPEHIYVVTGLTYNTLDNVTKDENIHFVVTGLDRGYNESNISNIVAVSKPGNTQLVLPVNAAQNVADTVNLEWNYTSMASSYILEIATDENFENMFKTVSGLKTLTYELTGMEGLTTYYWRVKSTNPAGDGEYSSVYSFTTGFPVSPTLVYPEHSTTGYPLDLQFIWNSSEAAVRYDFQVARSANFAESSIVLDTIDVADTLLNVELLSGNAFHFWRVKAVNDLGKSGWSEVYAFKTGDPNSVDDENSLPEKYNLAQNYPNPFNPVTTINFSIPEASYVSLSVYNILGEKVMEPVSEFYNPGNYNIQLNASKLPSGLYIYTMKAGSHVITKKMMLLK